MRHIVFAFLLMAAIACNDAIKSKEVPAVDSSKLDDTTTGKVWFALQPGQFEYKMILRPRLVDTIIPTKDPKLFTKGQVMVYDKVWFLRVIDTPTVKGVRVPRDTFIEADPTRILPDFKPR